jgi:hypothetical protein
LGKSSNIFYGVADTECSVLKFTDEVLYGETNQNPPFWGGIEGITQILDKLILKIEELEQESQLNNDIITTDKNNFENALATAGTDIEGENGYSYQGSNTYKLDIAKNFGKVANIENSIYKEGNPKNSITDLWIKEYNKSAINSDFYMSLTKTSFAAVLNQPSVTQNLNKGKESMKEIDEAFDEIKKKVAGNINKYADKFDSYGRLGYKLVFTILILIDAGLAAFMIMLCLCSATMCNCCKCTRRFCKFFIHILWNLMALCMCALFIFGSLFTLFGAYGKDMTSVLAFLVSEENLGEDKDTILLGDVKKYLNKCFNDNGEILREMGFGEEIEKFEALKKAEIKMEDIQNEFKNKKSMFVYKEYLAQINDRNEFKSRDLSLIAVDNTVEPREYEFTELLEKINTVAQDNSIKEHWDITSDSGLDCSHIAPEPEQTNYHPKKCWPTERGWVSLNSDLTSSKTIEILNAIKTSVELANSEGNNNGIKKILSIGDTSLKKLYEIFLDTEITTLSTFIQRIQVLTQIVSKYSGKNEKMFNFANCGFIKANIQVLIKNLKDAFGNDLYTIGVFFLLAAFSMAVAISSTILLIVIINKSTEGNNKGKNEKKDDDGVKEIPNSEERVFSKNELKQS